MENGFIPHLQCHSEYSLTHGILRLKGEQTVGKLAAERGISALALTDSNNIHGAIWHYESCIQHGVKPILGCHALFSDGGRDFQATLLCMDKAGFVNLSKLLSAAQENNDGRIAAAALTEESCASLIMLNGYGGDISEALRLRKPEQAQHGLERWLRLFGRERLALQLSFGEREYERALTLLLADLAGAHDVCCAAAHPILYPDPADFEAHEVRACIAHGWTLDDADRPRPYSPRQHMPDAAEMQELFKDFPAALANARELALRCNYDFGVNAAPQFPKIPNARQGEAAAALRAQAQEGLERIGGRGPKYEERLEHELDVIIDKGFADYFLIVADLADFAKRNDIPIGPGRGSGAGSLVAYALGITAADPMQYGLLFERFLNPERTSLPDFDIDFCKDRRDEIIEHARATYGADCVAQVITFGSLKARAVVRDVCRVLGVGYGQGDMLARMIPNEIGITLEEALAKVPELKEHIAANDYEQLWRYCLALEGLPRQPSTHAAAILIAPRPLVEHCPVTAVGDSGSRQRLVSQYDKDCAERIGLIKFDILGLKNLTMIRGAERMIQRQSPQFAIDAIDLGDARTYELYHRGDTIGIFQCESRGMVEMIRRIQPRSVEDVAIAISLYRPGALNNDMDEKYLRNRRQPEQVEYEHPKLEQVLSDTYGAVVYQEQVMLIAQVMAGFSLAEADTLRSAMGKKDVNAMKAQGARFIEGCGALLSRERAKKLFDDVSEFAGYGFNKSHAIAYALVSVHTAYLKAHHPTEFYAAALSAWTGDPRSTETLLRDAKKRPGITIAPPCVNASQADFSIDGKGVVRHGLSSLRGVGEACAAGIVAEREERGAYRSLDDLCLRVPAALLNKRVLESLVGAGACDGLLADTPEPGKRRAALLASCGAAMESAEHQQRNADQGMLFESQPSAAPASARLDVPPLRPHELLTREQQAMGVTLSGEFSDILKRLRSASHNGARSWRGIGSVRDMEHHGAGTWIGHVARRVTSGRLRGMGKEAFILDDGEDSVEVRVERRALGDIRLDAPGTIVAVRGAVEANSNRDFPPSIEAEQVFALDAWLDENVSTMTVDCQREEDLDWCLQHLAATRGSCKLRFVLQRGGAAVEVDTREKIRLDAELFEHAYARLGAATLRLD